MKLTMTAALDTYLSAQRDLGPDLGGGSLADLLADNFPEASIAECTRVAAQLVKDTGMNGPTATIPEYLFVGFKQTPITRATDDVRWVLVAAGLNRDHVGDLTQKSAARSPAVPYVVRAYRLSGGVS